MVAQREIKLRITLTSLDSVDTRLTADSHRCCNGVEIRPAERPFYQLAIRESCTGAYQMPNFSTITALRSGSPNEAITALYLFMGGSWLLS
jgi:hypothetical protein